MGPGATLWGGPWAQALQPIVSQNTWNICEKAPRSIASHLLFSSFLREYLWIEAERSIVYNSRKRMPLFGAVAPAVLSHRGHPTKKSLPLGICPSWRGSAALQVVRYDSRS